MKFNLIPLVAAACSVSGCSQFVRKGVTYKTSVVAESSGKPVEGALLCYQTAGIPTRSRAAWRMTETDKTGHALVIDMVSDGVMLVYHPEFRMGSFDRWGASPRCPLHSR